MPILSRWIIGFGLLLIGCALAESLPRVRTGLDGRLLNCMWAGGALMLAAGLGAAQGRRSLRLGGLWVATLLPLALTALFALRAASLWRRVTASNQPLAPAIISSALALASIGLLWIIFRLRPRDGIASRGYAVTVPSAKRPAANVPKPQEAPRRSEAG